MANQKRSSGRQPADSAVAEPQPTEQSTPAPESGAPPVAAAPQGGPDAPPAPPKAGKPVQTLNINDLKDMSIQKLTQVAKDLNVAGATGMRPRSGR
jgi:hypothetical protein